jgi:hypothetical protein
MAVALGWCAACSGEKLCMSYEFYENTTQQAILTSALQRNGVIGLKIFHMPYWLSRSLATNTLIC